MIAPALAKYAAGITEHIEACDCERCCHVRMDALATHGYRIVLETFGAAAAPEAVLAELASVDRDVTVVQATRHTMPWSGDDELGTRTLTRREVRVAELVCSGMSRSEIAVMLGLSPKTFDTHRGHVLQKMRCANEVQLVRLAVMQGWVAL